MEKRPRYGAFERQLEAAHFTPHEVEQVLQEVQQPKIIEVSFLIGGKWTEPAVITTEELAKLGAFLKTFEV
jgi:hypothetical protein